MGEIYAYIRVSTKEQNTDRQVENIKKNFPSIKDENMFIEKVSGKKGVEERSEYAVLRRIVRAGDELVIDALDRLGRRKADIKAELEYLCSRNVKLRVLLIPTTLVQIEGQDWAIDMINNLLIEVYSSLAQQELAEKERRQRDGIAIAKTKGVYKGRKPISYDMERFESLYHKWKSGILKSKDFMDMMGLKPNTFYRIMKRYEEKSACCS